MLYENQFLNSNPSDASSSSNEFWYCFQHSIDENKHGNDGKRCILSIIADQFTYNELQRNLNVCFKIENFPLQRISKLVLFTNFYFLGSISHAKTYLIMNAPGCL